MTLVALSFLGVALLAAAVIAPPQAATAPTLEEALRAPILPPETAHAEIRAYLEKRIPPLPNPTSAAAWEVEAERLRRRILEEVVFRGVPARWRSGRTTVEWGERIAASGGYAIRKF